jgi:hypothetical protein
MGRMPRCLPRTMLKTLWTRPISGREDRASIRNSEPSSDAWLRLKMYRVSGRHSVAHQGE